MTNSDSGSETSSSVSSHLVPETSSAVHDTDQTAQLAQPIPAPTIVHDSSNVGNDINPSAVHLTESTRMDGNEDIELREIGQEQSITSPCEILSSVDETTSPQEAISLTRAKSIEMEEIELMDDGLEQSITSPSEAIPSLDDTISSPTESLSPTVQQSIVKSRVSSNKNASKSTKTRSLLQIQNGDKRNEDRIFFINGGEKVKQPQKYKSNSISTTKYILGFRIHKRGWKLGPWGKIGMPPKKDSNGKTLPGATVQPFDLPYIQFPFIIQNIFEQFHRVANLYFLFIIILQNIPGLSPTGRYSTLLPFGIVIIFSFLKDMFEDMKRRIGDLKTNTMSKSHVFKKGKWTEVKWKDIKVGDLLMIKDKERFPCDIILLSTSQEQGLAYVETASLDGETNLKVKKALDDTLPIQGDAISQFVGRIVCQRPNKNLHKFNGRILIQGPYMWLKDVRMPVISQKVPETLGNVSIVHVAVGDAITKGTPICEVVTSEEEKLTIFASHDCQVVKLPVVGECYSPGKPIWSFQTRLEHLENTPISFSADQQLLRGSSLRNTDWIIGVAMYTGHETKLLMNQNATPHKASRVERLTNRFIVIIFALLAFLSLICAVGKMIHVALNADNEWYLKEFENGVTAGDIIWSGFSAFFTFIILFNNLVPISLYVSMEMAKFAQAYFMSQDRDMYYDEKDIATVVRSSSLNEELGQVEYIFSDKTGTLTRNKMDFLKYSVNGIVYGTGITEIERANAARRGMKIVNDRPPGFDENQEFRFWDSQISDGHWATLSDANDHRRFFIMLALCHTVIPEKDAAGQVVYNASSPDEGALVKAAKYLGVEFISRTTYSMTIKVQGIEETWQLLNILEFNSTRKRMSVIVRNSEGKLILFTKGADNVIYERLSTHPDDNIHAEHTLKLLENLADAGLRTLVCAEAEVEEEFYQEWRKEYQEVMLITDPAQKEAEMDRVNEKIERDLKLIGVTAIEDLLQVGVPETIADLKRGHIKIWILTGDKQETAKNIGFACDLLNTEMTILEPKGESISELQESMNRFIKTYSNPENRKNGLGLIVNGMKLGWLMENAQLKSAFLRLGTMCEAVVCCRVSPLQKSQVVSLVKDNMNCLTLAIGDGANDVPMIQAAHVGVGIAGEEGQQAANASDYSVGQFRFLKRLLLVHGQYSYRRISKLILYSFYKNIVLYLSQLWFVFYNAWSGTSVHDKWTISAFNVLFAFLPIMALGIFDRHISPTKAMEFPQLYSRGHQNVYFNFWSFLGWILNAIYHSCICFFIPVLAMYYPDTEGNPWNGSSRDMLGLGITIFTAVLLTITGKVNLEMESYTTVHAIANWGSLLIWWLFMFAYAAVYWALPYYVIVLEETFEVMEQYRTMLTVRFYLTVVLTAVLALAKDFIWKAVKRFLRNDLFYAVQSVTIPEIKMNMSQEERDRITEEWQSQKEEILQRYPVKARMRKFKLSRKKSKDKQYHNDSSKEPNRGFAFSQTPGQAEILSRVLSQSIGGPGGSLPMKIELQEIEIGAKVDTDNKSESNSQSSGKVENPQS